MQDLPIGIDPDGADAWAWQDVLAIKTTVGVPPDQYNTKGQNWGMPPSCPISSVLPDTNHFARLSERIFAMPEDYV